MECFVHFESDLKSCAVSCTFDQSVIYFINKHIIQEAVTVARSIWKCSNRKIYHISIKHQLNMDATSKHQKLNYGIRIIFISKSIVLNNVWLRFGIGRQLFYFHEQGPEI